MELNAGQLVLLGFIATVLVQGYKLVSARLGVDVGRKVTTIVIVVVSVGLSYMWLQPTVPDFSDPMQFATQLITAAGAVLGFATVIYNFLMAKVFEKTGLVKYNFLRYG